METARKKLPKSVRKFIRLEKARIRAMVLDFKKQEEMISELYEKLLHQPVVKSEAVQENKVIEKPIEVSVEKEHSAKSKTQKAVKIKKSKTKTKA